jgi:hypothetical protein
MDNELEKLVEVLEKLSEHHSTSSPLTLNLRRVDRNYLDLQMPNVNRFRCHRDEFEAFAAERNLPRTLAILTPLLVEGRIDNPLLFFYASLTALALENGYGHIKIDYPDSRSFVGTLGITYRSIR